jgi:L-ascorbate metabolism protein UlaG (beta-lactamase superfamily)
MASEITKTSTVTLTWLGHSCFLMKTGKGHTVLIDPYDRTVGYPVKTIDGVDLVIISHDHYDHNYFKMASGSPTVIWGARGLEFIPIDREIMDLHIKTVQTAHDTHQGVDRGKNAMFIFETGEPPLHIIHCGDLGHTLDSHQVQAAGKVDVMMIPVGGTYTINTVHAVKVVNQLKPRIIIPMHFRTSPLNPSMTAKLLPVDEFLKALGTTWDVQRPGHLVTFDGHHMPATQTVVVLDYQA